MDMRTAQEEGLRMALGQEDTIMSGEDLRMVLGPGMATELVNMMAELEENMAMESMEDMGEDTGLALGVESGVLEMAIRPASMRQELGLPTIFQGWQPLLQGKLSKEVWQVLEVATKVLLS